MVQNQLHQSVIDAAVYVDLIMLLLFLFFFSKKIISRR